MRSLDEQRRDSLTRILEAQYQLAKAAGITNPDAEPFIQDIKSHIRALTKERKHG